MVTTQLSKKKDSGEASQFLKPLAARHIRCYLAAAGYWSRVADCWLASTHCSGTLLGLKGRKVLVGGAVAVPSRRLGDP